MGPNWKVLSICQFVNGRPLTQPSAEILPVGQRDTPQCSAVEKLTK